MSVTAAVTNKTRTSRGSRLGVFATLTLTGTYGANGIRIGSTSGYEVQPSAFGLAKIEEFNVLGATGTGLKFDYDQANMKLIAKSLSGAGVTRMQLDIFPSVKASKAPADDVVGTAVYSDITGGASLLGANYAYVVTTQIPVTAVGLSIAAQPDVPRNVNITCHNINGGTVANKAIAYLVTGTFNGAAQTETISIPVASGGTMANGTAIYKSGLKPFDSITSIVPTITSGPETTGFQVIVGLGSLIGLSRALATPVEADVIVVTKQGTPVTISSIVTATAGSESVKFGTITAADDLVVKYATKDSSFAEIGSTTTTSTSVLRVEAIGY